jgi:hypothetical protein
MSEIERTLREMNRKLSELSAKVSQLETRNGGTVIEERKVPEVEGLFGGRAVLNSQGGIQKVTYVPFCDYCHSPLDENFVICSKCKKKLCDNCKIFMEGRNLCPDCFKSEYPLSKDCFKVLAMLQSNVAEEEMAEVAGMREEEIYDHMSQLFREGYIIREGISIFSKVTLTQKGFTAFLVYERLFEKDVDISYFKERLARGESLEAHRSP